MDEVVVRDVGGAFDLVVVETCLGLEALDLLRRRRAAVGPVLGDPHPSPGTVGFWIEPGSWPDAPDLPVRLNRDGAVKVPRGEPSANVFAAQWLVSPTGAPAWTDAATLVQALRVAVVTIAAASAGIGA